LACIQRALDLFKNDKTTWRKIQNNGMAQNLSWDKSALEYLALYKNLIN